MLRISIAAILLFSLSGCCNDPVIPPKIVVLKKVPDIQVTDGCICGNEISKVIQLRKSEDYYFEQVTDYNKRFTKDK